MKRILVLNGPNLNLLGRREPEVYGRTSWSEVEARLRQVASELGVELDIVQSNHEGELLDAMHKALGRHDGILLNPGALTHTSVALYDGLLAVGIPAVEVHLSNPHRREGYRRRSWTARAAMGTVTGFGGRSYEWGLRALVSELSGR